MDWGKINKITSASIILLVVCLSKANALSIIGIPFETVVANADRILIGKIVGKTVIADLDGPSPKICGWKLEVEVEVPIRGTDAHFTLYTDDLRNLDVNTDKYFMLIKANEASNRDDDESYVTCDGDGYYEPRTGRGDIADIDYIHRTISYGTWETYLLPFDEYMSNKYGGDWLISDNGLPDTIYTEFVNTNENPNHLNAYLSINLFDFLKNNWELFSSPKKSSDKD